MSFLDEKVVAEGLTFDDVLLVPAYSEVLPREVSVASRFSRHVPINTPIVSAAMDTVTEAELAIAIVAELVDVRYRDRYSQEARDRHEASLGR